MAKKQAETLSYAERATKYAQDVVSGHVKACRYVRLICQRHLDDLGAKKSPYIFDEEAANRVCFFASHQVHVKGEWAGKTVELQDWQCFLLGSLFGWKVKVTGYRRYNTAYIQLPRKNGKSFIAAVIGLYMMSADGEHGAEVYSGATSEKQAMEVFRPAWAMVEKNKPLATAMELGLSGTPRNPGTIYREVDGSRFEAVVHKPGDGASPHCGIVDEYHEHNGPDLYDTFATGMGARRQPLLLVITTAGTNTSSPCFAALKRSIDDLEGTVRNETLFSLVYTIDEDADWKDFENWKIANPNYGVSVYEHFLKAQYDKAMTNVGERNILLCKHCNVWSNAGCSAFDMAAWAASADASLSLEDFAGCPATIGVDLASKVDIAAMSILVETNQGPVLFARHYLPEETVNRPENAHYRQWQAEGWLTVTDGVRTDFGRIEADLKEIAGLLRVRGLGYDPREASYLMASIAEWATFELVEVPQGPAQMSEAMKELEALIAGRELRHNGDPLLAWQMGNVVRKEAKGGGVTKSYYPTKQAENLKIDAAVAAIMAVKMAHAELEEQGGQLFVAV